MSTETEVECELCGQELDIEPDIYNQALIDDDGGLGVVGFDCTNCETGIMWELQYLKKGEVI